MSCIIGDGKALLDQVHTKLSQSTYISEAMEELVQGLRQHRQCMPRAAWEHFSQTTCRRHSIWRRVCQDPLSGRAFLKPRGYAEDGITIDLVYGGDAVESYLAIASELGRQIYHYTYRLLACCAVRARCALLARRLDDTATMRPSPHVLSIACGHLREAHHALAVRAGRMGRFVAFDQDPENLKVVQRDLAAYGVKTVVGSVRKLCQGEIDLGRFDFIYSAGLYDYLDQPTAQCLTAVLFQMLQPGGQLLVANFLPHGKDIGYMEAYLDWHLIYRTVAELEAVTTQLPAEAIADQHTFIEEHQTIAFLEISKR